MLNVRLLEGLPPYAAKPIKFPARWAPAGDEGIIVEFKTERALWVGNFKPGVVPGKFDGINLAGVHPNQRDAVVIAAGDLWVVNPETRTAQRVLNAIDGAFEVREPDGWIFCRYSIAFMRFGPDGLVWHTRRLSMHGFDKLTISKGALKGKARDTFDGRSRYFSVDLNTGRSTQSVMGSNRAVPFEIRTVKILSPNLASVLAMEGGKYWCWTLGLDAENLEALLWAVGEFARGWSSLRRPDGRLPEPVFYPHHMAEDRMRNALKILERLHSVGRVQLESGPFMTDDQFNPFPLSQQTPAFSSAYRERLLQQKQTAWAQGFDERSLGILLWWVGQYSVRVYSSQGPNGGEYPPPTFDGDPEITRRMRAALRVIGRICIIAFQHETTVTSAEVSRQIAEGEI